jgi:hypothetical protein
MARQVLCIHIDCIRKYRRRCCTYATNRPTCLLRDGSADAISAPRVYSGSARDVLYLGTEYTRSLRSRSVPRQPVYSEFVQKVPYLGNDYTRGWHNRYFAYSTCRNYRYSRLAINMLGTDGERLNVGLKFARRAS